MIEVLTDNGFQPFDGVLYKGEKETVKLAFDDGSYIIVTPDHKLLTSSGDTEVSELKIYSKVVSESGYKTIIRKEHVGEKHVYDLLNTGDTHRYVTNGVISHNCKFITQSYTLLDPFFLSNAINKLIKKPIKIIDKVRWFKKPEANKVYAVALDPAAGTRKDYAAIQVLEVPSMVQIAEWRSNSSTPKNQVRVLRDIMYDIEDALYDTGEQLDDPEIYYAVETNGVGLAAYRTIIETGEENFPGIFIKQKRTKANKSRVKTKGICMTNALKANMAVKLKQMLEYGMMDISSEALITELKFFINKGDNKFEAENGYNDDLVMSLLLALAVVEEVKAFLDEEDAEVLMDILEEYDTLDDEEIEEPLPLYLGL